MTFRDARPGDLERIVAVYNAAIPDGEATADTERVAPESRRRWLTERDFERRPAWVCEVDGAVAAWLSFEDFYGRPAYDAAAEIAVYVAPERRGSGLGRALLDRAVDRAHLLGLTTMLAFVFAHNATSVGLFRRRGFEEWGMLPRVARMPGGERDVLILGRKVDGAPAGPFPEAARGDPGGRLEDSHRGLTAGLPPPGRVVSVKRIGRTRRPRTRIEEAGNGGGVLRPDLSSSK